MATAKVNSRQGYDVVIVGAGPAGIFAALELSRHSNLRVLLLDKGEPLEKRRCPIIARGVSCVGCRPCDLVCGWGGAGAFSDGKLTLSTEVGGHLREYVGEERTRELVACVDENYVGFGGEGRLWGDGVDIEELGRRAALAGMRLVPMQVRHLGTERCLRILQGMREALGPEVEVRMRCTASRILVEDGKVAGVEMSDGTRALAPYVVIAPGREGGDWLVAEACRLKLAIEANPVDLGIRVELPAAVLEPITDLLYESKLEYYSRTFDDRVRTFCMCPHGEVTMEYTAGSDPVVTVNGHSYADRKTNNTNFALLVSTAFTEPFHQPIAYGRYIARLANILSGGVIVQRLGDLQMGRRSTEARIARNIVRPTLKGATPGDLSFVLPYRHLKDVTEMLEALEGLAPGVASPHTLLYGVEVKFYSSRLRLSERLETEVGGLFAAGDGAGVSRGLVQASASGVVIAREILRRAEEGTGRAEAAAAAAPGS